jgi:UPF0755 protein
MINFLIKLGIRLLMTLLVVGGALAGGAYWIYENRLQVPLPISQDARYIISARSNLALISNELVDKGFFDYPSAWTWFAMARWQQKAHRIKAGEYAIPVGMTPQQLLDLFVEGKTVQHVLTVPEGWTFRQLLTALHNEPSLTHKLKGLDDKAVMAQLGFPNQHPEGRFYPDTYHFPLGMSDIEFLQRAYHIMAQQLKTAWEKRAPDVILNTPDEALTLASIVEKETAVPSERPQIAGVFTRRLKLGMRLQTDPTVIYALGEAYDGNIHQQDLLVNSPYNTYVYKGLPPTPIALVGKEALNAALNPAAGDSLYFVAKGDGSHYFSATLGEHECAVIEYQLKNKAPARFRSRCHESPHCGACRNNSSSNLGDTRKPTQSALGFPKMR